MSTTFGILLESGKMKARRRRRRTKRVTNGFARIGVGKFSESSSANPFPPRRPQWLGWSVCFRSVRLDSAKPVMEWFQFSLEENYIMAAAEEQLTYDQLGGASSRDLVPIVDHDVVSGESWTSVGSTIYCVGGLCRDMSAPPGNICSNFSRHVRYFDADYPEDGWKTATPMITPRWKAKVVALHGKLYAFGGCSKAYAPWAEVFTPGDRGQGGHWKALRSFPSHHPSCSSGRIFAVAHESSNKILVGICYSGVAYEYNVAQKSCLELKLDLGSGILYRGPVDSQPVLVDNMMYWVLQGQLNAYDLETRMVFSGPIEDMSIQSFLNCSSCDDDDDEDDYPSVPSLLHLAEDDFCFLYMSSYSLHCVTLRVSKGINPDGAGSLRASVLSCQSFGFEYPACLLDALLL